MNNTKQMNNTEYKLINDLFKRFIENPYYEIISERDLSIVSDYGRIQKFLDSFKAWVEPIKDITSLDFLIRKFKGEHDYKTNEYAEFRNADSITDCISLEKEESEELQDHDSIDYYDLGKVKYFVALKTEYIDPIHFEKKEESVGFILVNEVDRGLEISAIFLEDEFRGKRYKNKSYSDMLMEEALKGILDDDGTNCKQISAYVQKGNKGPKHLLQKYRFLKEPSDREGYMKYVLELEK